MFRDGGLCIKVFNEEHPRSAVLHEALNMALMEEAGLRAPKLIRVEAIDGKWALTYEYVRGKSLDELMRKDPKKKTEYLQRFADIQLDFHAHRCPALDAQKESLGGRIARTDLDDGTKSALTALLETLPDEDRVCHGDYNPTNVIITDGGGACIIDWAYAVKGCPLFDAAKTYLLMWLSDDMNGAETYVNMYCRKSGASRDGILKYIPLAAASRLLNAHEHEKPALRRWIGAVRY